MQQSSLCQYFLYFLDLILKLLHHFLSPLMLINNLNGYLPSLALMSLYKFLLKLQLLPYLVLHILLFHILQYAVLLAGDPYRCRQYALSALDEACSVLLAGDAAALQRRNAGLYFRAAQQLARTADNAAPIPTRGEPPAGDFDRADNSWIPLESSTSEGRG